MVLKKEALDVSSDCWRQTASTMLVNQRIRESDIERSLIAFSPAPFAPTIVHSVALIRGFRAHSTVLRLCLCEKKINCRSLMTF